MIEQSTWKHLRLALIFTQQQWGRSKDYKLTTRVFEQTAIRGPSVATLCRLCIYKKQMKKGYYFTSSPERSREFWAIFLHYLMHFEVFFFTFSSQILSLQDIQCFL